MASANSLLCEEQLLCSICLSAFTEPVTTPCGHNYCKTCITGYWACSGLTQCPLCQRKFSYRPELQVNREFRDMVEHFKNMRMGSDDAAPVRPGEVPCDVCLGPKLKAQKSCLVCLASYCQSHLEPHQRVPAFKKHKLIDPVSNLEDRVCKKHDKMFELFCLADETCVCLMCLKDDHAMHGTIPLEEAFTERKARLEDVKSEMKMMEYIKTRSVKEMKCSIEGNRKESEKEIAHIDEALAALVASLRRRHFELIHLIQEKRTAAEKQAEDHVARLEKEVDELRRKRSQIEQLLQAEDNFHLLQSWSSLSLSEHNTDWLHPSTCSIPPFMQDILDSRRQSYVGMVKKAVAQMEKTLSDEMEVLICGVRLSDGSENTKQPDAAEKLVRDEFNTEVWNPPRDKLMMIQQCNAVDVALNAYVANDKFMVSEDGKQLRVNQGRIQQFFNALNSFRHGPESKPFALGKDGFSSGRFYYEVQISGTSGWLLGLAKDSIIHDIHSSLEDLSWTLSEHHCQEEHFGQSFIHIINYGCVNLRQRPQKVGVFADYEKGEISFYDVNARTLIYSYTGCAFSETTPREKGYLSSLVDSLFSRKLRLYPIFSFNGNEPNDLLEITPVVCST